MNTNLGLIAKKLGNTQIFNEDGSVTRVTVLSVGPCIVVGKRTDDKDGYSALVLGFGEKKDKFVRKPQAGQWAKLGVKAPLHVKEFRLAADVVAKFEVGQLLKPSEIFTVGQFVDAQGMTRGRGFTGVMARWNFKGAATLTHGTHEYMRHGGSIGTNMTPGRTLAGVVKMPGQYGNEQVTMLNLKIARIMDEEQILLVEGGVPGSKNGIVTIKAAVKKLPKN